MGLLGRIPQIDEDIEKGPGEEEGESRHHSFGGASEKVT
jgi:hypothetical protein